MTPRRSSWSLFFVTFTAYPGAARHDSDALQTRDRFRHGACAIPGRRCIAIAITASGKRHLVSARLANAPRLGQPAEVAAAPGRRRAFAAVAPARRLA